MADNYLEKKMEALQARKAKEQRAKQTAWKKRIDAYRKRLAEEAAMIGPSSFFYDVAGHVFEVSLPGTAPKDVLKSYETFASPSVAEPAFTLRLEYADTLRDLPLGELKECLNDEPPYFWMFARDERYDFGFSYTKSHPDCILKSSQDYKEAVVYVQTSRAERLTRFALDNALMLMYAARTIAEGTLLIHASVVMNAGEGFVFLGRSGTGKSTHSRLWLENVEGSQLLNDDNPVIRTVDGLVKVYGSPWSGKTPCYINADVPLKGIVRLSQAPFNKISRHTPLAAYASLSPACSCMRWDRNATDALHRAVESVIMSVSGWHLECLPDADAAYVCSKALKSE